MGAGCRGGRVTLPSRGRGGEGGGRRKACLGLCQGCLVTWPEAARGGPDGTSPPPPFSPLLSPIQPGPTVASRSGSSACEKLDGPSSLLPLLPSTTVDRVVPSRCALVFNQREESAIMTPPIRPHTESPLRTHLTPYRVPATDASHPIRSPLRTHLTTYRVPTTDASHHIPSPRYGTHLTTYRVPATDASHHIPSTRYGRISPHTESPLRTHLTPYGIRYGRISPHTVPATDASHHIPSLRYGRISPHTESPLRTHLTTYRVPATDASHHIPSPRYGRISPHTESPLRTHLTPGMLTIGQDWKAPIWGDFTVHIASLVRIQTGDGARHHHTGDIAERRAEVTEAAANIPL